MTVLLEVASYKVIASIFTLPTLAIALTPQNASPNAKKGHLDPEWKRDYIWQPFVSCLSKKFKTRRSAEAEVACEIIDQDHLKTYNDTYVSERKCCFRFPCTIIPLLKFPEFTSYRPGQGRSPRKSESSDFAILK